MRRDAWRSIACVLLAALGLIVFTDDVACGQETFSLVGTVTDKSNAPLPGVNVTMSNGSDKRVAVTDAQGRFEFAGSLPGTYRVDAALVGFRTGTRHVDVGAARSTRLDIALRVAALEIVDRVILTPEEQIQFASAIGHIRIHATKIPLQCSDENEFDVVHDASALSVLKGDLTGVIELARYMSLECAAGEPIPTLRRPISPIGSEFVMLLYPMESGAFYSGWSQDTTFPVRKGRVETHGFNGLPPEMELEAFKAALMRLVQ